MQGDWGYLLTTAHEGPGAEDTKAGVYIHYIIGLGLTVGKYVSKIRLTYSTFAQMEKARLWATRVPPEASQQPYDSLIGDGNPQKKLCRFLRKAGILINVVGTPLQPYVH